MCSRNVLSSMMGTRTMIISILYKTHCDLSSLFKQLELMSPETRETLHLIHHRTFVADYASGGAVTLSGTSGFTSVTTRSRSSTTVSPVLLPRSLICFSCSSASLLASSSACLLPLVCYPSSIHQLLYLLRAQRRVVFEKRKTTFFSNSLNSSSFCFR